MSRTIRVPLFPLAGAILFPENPAAMVRNARDNTLVKALFGG